jgi:hypothetical protein
MKNRFLILAQATALACAGCSTMQHSSGFNLPQGDPTAGKAAFTTMKCHVCHSVVGHQFPAPSALPAVPVVLGAEKKRPTPGQLADSIVNPSHRLEPGYGEELVRSGKLSRMGDYSEVMTVRQLSDLVAFLDTLSSDKYGKATQP